MTAGLAKLTKVESKIFLRDPASVFFGLAFPSLLLIVLGSIPAFRQPNQDLGGQRTIDVYLPIVVAMAIGILALSALPTYLASYREKGVLRRLATTPVQPSGLLAAQLAVNLLMAVGEILLLFVIGTVAFHTPLPRNVIAFVLAFLLSAAAMLGIGLIIAALAPSSRAAGMIGSLVYFPMLFFAGMWLPRDLMPAVLRRISDYTPLGSGVQSLQDAANGHWPHLLALAVLAGYVAVTGLVAARTFRWE
ncbi:MAG TPA: ABC transporter permease [Mycobacteriales bacterium]|nr:ABC transporter permease [Mycobacteriales bacterium]